MAKVQPQTPSEQTGDERFRGSSQRNNTQPQAVPYMHDNEIATERLHDSQPTIRVSEPLGQIVWGSAILLGGIILFATVATAVMLIGRNRTVAEIVSFLITISVMLALYYKVGIVSSFRFPTGKGKYALGKRQTVSRADPPAVSLDND